MKTTFSRIWMRSGWVAGLLATPLVFVFSQGVLHSPIGSLILAFAWMTVMICGILFDWSAYNFGLGKLDFAKLTAQHKRIYLSQVICALTLTVVSSFCSTVWVAALCGMWMLVSILCYGRLDSLLSRKKGYLSVATPISVADVFGLIIIEVPILLFYLVMLGVLDITLLVRILLLACVFSGLVILALRRLASRNV